MDVPIKKAMKKLDDDIKLFLKQIKEEMAEVQKKVAIIAAERLVYTSPVWTGAYVRSMRCGIGVVDTTHEPAGSGMMPYPPRMSEAEAEMVKMGTFAKIRAEIESAPQGGAIYLSNSIPYAMKVEFTGWYLSPDGIDFLQAPHHVFTTVIQDLEYILR